MIMRFARLALFIFVTAASWAQEVSAELTGRVTDPSGSPIAKASITARDLERAT
jgi:hypothetical protein